MVSMPLEFHVWLMLFVQGRLSWIRDLLIGKLDLSDNPLGLEGTVAIGRMLSSNHCQL